MQQYIPTEDTEQAHIFAWAAWASGKYPELDLMHHIPNGGKRSKSEAARFKAQGVKAGVPDIFLPCARGGYHGLYIELKRTKGGKLSAVQKEWIDALRGQDYKVIVCYGFDEAREVIINYLEEAK
nr:MAG TPA: Nuclease [Caudoviricetes sp.]